MKQMPALLGFPQHHRGASSRPTQPYKKVWHAGNKGTFHITQGLKRVIGGKDPRSAAKPPQCSNSYLPLPRQRELNLCTIAGYVVESGEFSYSILVTILNTRVPMSLHYRILPLLLLCGFHCQLLAQVHYHDDGSPWLREAKRGPDAQVGGWYYNMGITGIRVQLMKEEPNHLQVKYVFADSPAAGNVRVDDVITGAAGEAFQTPHKNGYGVDVFGGEGPIKDFGKALDSCQNTAGKGKLELNLLRQGEPQQVTLSIGTRYGSYGETFPHKCPKSKLILSELYEYIASQQRDDGFWGAPQHNTFAPLALMASQNPKYEPQILKCVRQHAATTKANDRGSLINWRYMAAGIVLSEYYLATQEDWVLKELEEIRDFLQTSQYTRSDQIAESAKERKLPRNATQAVGGWGHNPGFEGYGPIGMTTGQGAIVFALMQRCGIEINRMRHDQAYEFLDRGTGKNGYVWYADEVARHDQWADMGRTGAAGIANFLSPYPEAKYTQRALAHARCIGQHPESFPDTHGSPIMGMGYAALAANIDGPSVRKLLDSNRWWFTLAQCHDGTFYFQPNRDYCPYDYYESSRISASAVVALIFSMQYGNLHLTGLH